MKGLVKSIGTTIFLALIAAALIAYWTSTNDCGRSTASPSNPMKAIVYCDYGPPEVLHLDTVEKPTPADNEVLIKVLAASVNPLDWHRMRGTPYLIRLHSGLRKPRQTRLGVDFAGRIESVGRNVTRFKPGDEVFGAKAGSLAEYITVAEDGSIAVKPATVPFEQAASLPVAGVTALQALRDQGKLESSQRVLINGASGGVGTFAVQIAKALGGDVTAVCGTNNLSLIRSIGADWVIDYTQKDFTKGTERYDLIVDQVGNHSLAEYRHVLTPNGRYVLVGGAGSRPNEARWIGPFARSLQAKLLSPFVSQKLETFRADLTQSDLNVLRDLVQTGKVRPVIDRRYKLSESPEALRYLEEGHARGKVVITFEEN